MTYGLFVTGTDTNVGKTLLSALLVAALNGIYWKPIQTGAVEGTDRQTVIQFAEVGEERTARECYVFDPPVSPHLAAASAGVAINFSNIQLPAPAGNRPLIAEGAGGIMVPINENQTMLDLARHLGLPVIVASRTALGTINHTVLTVRALRAAGMDLRGVVMIGPPSRDNEKSIEKYAPAPIIGRIPWLPEINRRELLRVFESEFDRKYFEFK